MVDSWKLQALNQQSERIDHLQAFADGRVLDGAVAADAVAALQLQEGVIADKQAAVFAETHHGFAKCPELAVEKTERTLGYKTRP